MTKLVKSYVTTTALVMCVGQHSVYVGCWSHCFMRWLADTQRSHGPFSSENTSCKCVLLNKILVKA
ncbi:hypothetical protein SKAU_G00421240 [Synaphobranchus kaupii]|uniref:Uncharacterized protein n=1 Tax=Synaphobranchus kaupii TaxID=118154 RepID=A0A9Q1E6N5_SYNKA|nr:hypothetical protein SKAU_G00421240 [Synaphobranchus kaupii]